jgi:hypothetical protein
MKLSVADADLDRVLKYLAEIVTDTRCEDVSAGLAGRGEGNGELGMLAGFPIGAGPASCSQQCAKTGCTGSAIRAIGRARSGRARSGRRSRERCVAVP